MTVSHLASRIAQALKMSNWDDEDWEADSGPSPAPSLPVPAAGGMGNWDDEDLPEEEEDISLKKPSAPMKPSKARALALKKKEEEEQRLATARAIAREKEMEELSAVERKMRQQKLVEQADLENVKDLFMEGSSNGGMRPPAEPTIDTFKPVTEEDYNKYAAMISEHCVKLSNINSPTKKKQMGLYVSFVKQLMRGLAQELSQEDTKDLSTFMGLLSNEKRDQFKKSKGYKKKTSKKTHVRVDREDDMRGDVFDDFADDFM